MFSRVRYPSLANLTVCLITSQPNSSTINAGIYEWNSTITRLFKHGDIENARRLFDEMPKRNTVTWNCMISGYVQNWRIAEAHRLFDVMVDRNIVSWTALLSGYAKCGRLEEAKNLFDSMPERNVVCWNSMISGYVSNGRIEEARELFNEMPVRNSISWAVMIDGYFRQELVSEAQVLFDQSYRPTIHVYNAMLSGYVEAGYFDDACKLFNRMSQQDRDVASWTTMITCNSRSGQIERARELFDEMPKRDMIAWTSMIYGYLNNGNIKDARILFDNMPHRDIVAWNSIIAGYVQNGMMENALQLFMQMPKHDIVSWNSILQGYAEQGDTVNAGKWFREMPRRDETSWNIMISGCRNEEALVLYSMITRDGLKPNQITYTSVISECGALAVLHFGRSVHLCVIKTGYDHDSMVVSSLITMYSKCGLIVDAALVFERMVRRDTVAWNAMIVAQAYHGYAFEAVDLYSSMVQFGFKPNHITFLGLLTACAHKGLVDKGWEFFTSMENDWLLIPEPGHYTCMVDMLGRAGLLIQAYEFIKQIQVDLPMYTWETLLSACRVHGNIKLGELVAKEILNTQPTNGGMYVLLSNIYAAKGMWKDVGGIRSLMKRHAAKKEPGCSWTEIKGNMYTFVYGDRSHPQTEGICRELEILSVMVEEIG
ncbi:hypothetical protein GIB67_012167 [Kingdonia uniflora]|uniref:Chlororespiratory reduction 4 n=1 Tax=Kingdonia uniflora TaxID=39325 RepID=A0A7J7NNK6_9MAGN|nr:hypothetical protein GIB67_012167 [Kingdonia uniflora]